MVNIPRLAVLLAAFFVLLNGDQSKVLRMATWNVADNSRMDEQGFSNQAIDRLMDIIRKKSVADIFAVGLQEQCWRCNKERMMEIGQAFMRRLNVRYAGVFEMIGIEGTRESSQCEKGCESGTHGTTALLVIAKKGLCKSHKSFHFNKGCSTKNNNEKGVAYMRMNLNTGQSICLATSHLESRSPKYRRQCLRSFFTDANKNVDWSAGCDFHFLSGDINTRTAAAASPNQNSYIPPQMNFSKKIKVTLISENHQKFFRKDMEKLKANDEMSGSTPFGQDEDWQGNLLGFINSVQSKVFKESPLQFPPTYKLAKDATPCDGKVPCYRTDRPLSWTDRIIYTNGKSLNYNSIQLLDSDHLPVVLDFQLS